MQWNGPPDAGHIDEAPAAAPSSDRTLTPSIAPPGAPEAAQSYEPSGRSFAGAVHTTASLEDAGVAHWKHAAPVQLG
jgi:hypothetical protein